jgi:phosphoglycolate phosphatase-like HAD superfamily hydrolase
MTGYDSLLLDHDGVLVNVLGSDTRVPAFQNKFEATVEADGFDQPTREQITPLANSITHDEVHSLGDQFGIDPERLWQYRDDCMADVLTEAVHAGEKTAFEDTAAIASLDHPVGVASNNQTRFVEFVLEHYEMTDHVETVHAREPHLSSLERKKPEPVFLEAAKADLGVDNPLYVGDKETDIIAGQRAGMDTAFLRRDHNRDVTPATRPTHEVSGLDEVAELLSESTAVQ